MENDKCSKVELARLGAGACVVEDQVYLWRGDSDGRTHVNDLCVLDLNSTGTLRRVRTDSDNLSQFPLGSCSMAICSIGHVIYTFGGWHSDKLYYSRSDLVHALDLQKMIWREVVAVNPEVRPGRKDKCGMVENLGNLCIFGGYGYRTSHQEKEGLFSQEPGGFLCWTNELHLFNVQTREWSVPECVGTPPPPCAAFSFNKIDQHRVLLFGGRQCYGRVNDVHILNMDTWEWSGAKYPIGDLWPSPRSFHSAVCLRDPNSGSTRCQKLLVLWGMDLQADPINDIWLLDVDQMKWTQLPCAAGSQRVWHSTVAYYPSEHEASVLTFGGSPVNVFQHSNVRLSEVVKMEFGVKSLYRICAAFIIANIDLFRPSLVQLPPRVLTYINKLI